MKKGIVTGVIVGFISGIVMTIFDISDLFKLFSVTFAGLPLTLSVQDIFVFNTIYFVISGILWGVLYAFFYDSIPGKGVRKGIVFGLIIWIIAPIHNAGVAMYLYGWYMFAIPYVIATFFSITITFGLLIGILYKK
ncbi:hypothetical protein [[Eubacterium] cellulosolvens]